MSEDANELARRIGEQIKGRELRSDDALIAAVANDFVALRRDGDPPLGALAAFVAARMADADGMHPVAAGDLYLAFLCASGVATAATELTERHSGFIAQEMRRVGLLGSALEDACQAFLERLLVGRAGVLPTIGQYKGRSALRSWLRVSATRFALNFRRDHRPRGMVATTDSERAPEDQELVFLERLYGPALESAMTRAFSRLDLAQRNLIRQHYFDGLSLDALARIERVHRTTVARWIAEAEESVFVEARRLLRAGLACGERTVDEIIGLLRGRVDLSVHKFFSQP